MFSPNKLFIITLFTCFCGLQAMAQAKTSRAEQLKRIKTVEQAGNYLEKTGSSTGCIGRFNSVADSVEYKEISRKFQVGDVFYAKTSTYKLLVKESEQVRRCQYIFLDGNKYTKQKIDSLKAQIIAGYRSGQNFTSLVAQYANGDKRSGDSGWFYGSKMPAAFSSAVADHLKGQVFTCDAEDGKSAYVILKTHLDRPSESWVYIFLK